MEKLVSNIKDLSGFSNQEIDVVKMTLSFFGTDLSTNETKLSTGFFGGKTN